MSIPKYDEIIIPAMELMKQNSTMKLQDFVNPLAKHFVITNEEINEKYPSGNAKIFRDRISWALSYLNMAELLDKPTRGSYKLNNLGIKLLEEPLKVNSYIKEQVKKRELNKQNQQPIQEQAKINVYSSDNTPQENLYTSFEKIKESVYDEILESILNGSSTAFEKLVVQLLQKMGYGGEIKNSGQVTKPTRDGGIDGIIKEDVLGLGRIHIQAKRYSKERTIGRDEIQKFVGALAGVQSNKGVFITTSYYSQDAIDYASNLSTSTIVVLIDGKQLAQFIYDYELGMQVEQTLEIKKLDPDFWDSIKYE